MKKKGFKHLLDILDGKPTNTRGQSMVELALTMPIFLIMLIGLVEVGWFANNYLILSDVVRAGARVGSLNDPLTWPIGAEKHWNRLDCDVNVGSNTAASGTYFYPRRVLPNNQQPPVSLSGFEPGVETTTLGYFDEVACNVMANMDPLEFKEAGALNSQLNETNDPRYLDDIVVSAFGYVRMSNCGSGTPCMRVVSRFPSSQNECNIDPYDPFDVNRNGTRDMEVEIESPFYDASSDEGIRGYVFRGTQVVPDGNGCIGSEFSAEWVEEQLMLTLTDADSTGAITDDELSRLPSYGLVMVEIQWWSYQLLRLPFFTWVGDPFRIHVWSMFPVSAAEPDFDCWSFDGSGNPIVECND